jgi:predicted ABC-type ATPase
MPHDSGTSPQLVVIAGPNGAGKSTSAPLLLRDSLHIFEFVNADTIAQGLSGFSPGATAVAAGRIMLQRLNDLASSRRNFAFETTLASRSYASWFPRLRADGFRVRLLFLWLASPQLAIDRVRQRVESGGHHVDRETITRRFERGLTNFFQLYRPIVDDWRMYNSAAGLIPRLIASGEGTEPQEIADPEVWSSLRSSYEHA